MLSKKIWVLVFSFMYLVSVYPMDRSQVLIFVVLITSTENVQKKKINVIFVISAVEY